MTTEPIKRHVLMIDNYDSFTWNLYQYLHQSPKCGKVDVLRNDKVTISQIENEIKPDVIFISPGPGHPITDSGISREAIRYFSGKIPIFGVCMGQECIFDVFGGDVSYAGEIVHGKTTTIKHDGKGMFENVPQSVAVTRYHSLAGSSKTLPDVLKVTAVTETKPEIIMGVRHATYTVEAVQFHPESILTESGQLMIDNLLGVFGGTWEENEKIKKGGESKENILTKIYNQRKVDYEAIQKLPGKSFKDLQTQLDLGLAPPLINFYDRLKATQSKKETAILAEFKRASPSKGPINMTANPAVVGLEYSKNGASTISVLTEEHWFKGSLDDLRVVRKVVDSNANRPAILRKDFVFSEYQILEARLAGADTVLLIVKMLTDEELLRLYNYSISLGLVPLIEVNNPEELKRSLDVVSSEDNLVIGVNNRNLTSFEVDMGTTTSLVDAAKNTGRKGDVLLLALSGIDSVDAVVKYKKENIDGFLIGESLMKAPSTAEFLSSLVHSE